MKKIKKSIITKHVGDYQINCEIKKTYLPKAGDVAIFKVLELGKHSSIQAENGNNHYIFPDDQIMAVFGTRYATAQFEGYLPTQYHDNYQILGKGGVVGVMASCHKKFDDIGATQLELVGYAVDENNEVINTIYKNAPRIDFDANKKRDYKIYLSLGASMDSGKTTTAAFLSRGFMLQNQKVAFIKLTGTVYARDCSFVRSCGADMALDFSYAGYPSTYMNSTAQILDILETVLHRIEAIKPDVVVIEVADGLLQRETKALIEHKAFMNLIDGVLLSCADSLSVTNGVRILSNVGHKPMLICGIFTTSPLMVKEVVDNIDVPVFTLENFTDNDSFRNIFMPNKK